MKRRLLKISILVFAIPLATIVAFSILWGSQNIRLSVLIVGILIELAVITVCKKCLKPLFNPLLHIADHMGVERIASPYEPGRYKLDFNVANIGIYLAALAPLCAYAAKLRPKTVVIPVLNDLTYTTANFDLLFTAFALMAAGALSIAIWAKLGQAMMIANELSEKNRYLLRGFAEEIDNPDSFYSYRMLIKKL